MKLSSEILMAIKIGKAKVEPVKYDKLCNTLSKLDVDIRKDAISDSSLSNDLRMLTTHEGDVSFFRFADAAKLDSYVMKDFCYFIHGINYMYPESSMGPIIEYFNEVFHLKCTHNGQLMDRFNKNVYNNI